MKKSRSVKGNRQPKALNGVAKKPQRKPSQKELLEIFRDSMKCRLGDDWPPPKLKPRKRRSLTLAKLVKIRR